MRRLSASQAATIPCGFSLTELMVTIVVALILFGTGVPGFRSLLQGQRMTTTVNDFFAAINLTRSEAIQRGTSADLVPADGANWNSGWIVFIDGNGNRKADSGDIVIYTHGAVPAGIRIDAAFTDVSTPYLSYGANGRTHTYGSDATAQFGNWSFVQDGKVRRKIIIGFLGRPRACTPDADSNCGSADPK